ncbi:hypothetical protein JW998_12245 [candidate division KSB1 bacterium]|nr:hypothetical protein [candidate division KSB1 bacterium]
MIRTNFLTYCVIFCLLAPTILCQTVFVPSTHWVYDFLDRLEAKRITPIVLAGTRPMTRAEIARHLDRADEARGKLSKTERDQLDFLLFEFQEHATKKSSQKTRIKKFTELSWMNAWWPEFLYPLGRHLLEIDAGSLEINFDPIFYRSRLYANDDTLQAQERVNIDTNGFLLWGTVGPYVGYYTDVRDSREWGTRSYPAGNTTEEGLGFVQGNGRQIYHDETVAYVLFSRNYLHLQFGKDTNIWGPAYGGQLFLSEHATSYDQLKLQLVFKRIKFTYLLAWLKHYTPGYFSGDPITKMMAAHRFEFSPHRLIDIGLQSAVIYGGRSFEPSYMNPVMFYRSAEHYLGDLDNAAMGLDAELKLIPRTKLYGELFIDDLTTGKIGTGFYGNKVGYTAGALCVDLFGLPNLDLRAEYTAVRPFTYSHKDTVTAYAHFSTSLGHWSGPNAALWTGRLSYRFSRRIVTHLTTQLQKSGANTPDENVGGDLWRPHDPGTDAEYVDFLAGIQRSCTTVRAEMSYEFIRNGFIEMAYSSESRASEQALSGIPISGKREEIVLNLSFNF